MQLSTDYKYFELDGINSERYGLFLVTRSSDEESITGLKRSLETEETVGDLVRVNRVKNDEISFDIELTKYRNNQLETFEMEDIDAINRWFFAKKGERILRVGNKIYKGYFTGASKWIRGDRLGTLTYQFTMPNGFVEIVGECTVNSKTDVTRHELYNYATAEEYTDLNITIDNIKSTVIKIKNLTTGDYIDLLNVNSNMKIEIYSDINEIFDANNGKVSVYKYSESSKHYPRLSYGRNIFEVKGNCRINFSWKSKMCL